jgi:hypothetical protein
MGWLSPKTTAEEKTEDHRRRGFEGPVDQDGDAHMSRRSDRPFGWTGTGSPDDKDSPRAGSLARRSRRS